MAMLRGLTSGVFRSLTINRNFSSRTSMEELRSLRMVTAIKTPYKSSGQTDFASYDNLVNMQIEKGVQGILVGPVTGESPHISRRLLGLISHTCKSFGNKIKIIGNFGGKPTYATLRASEIGFSKGMDAAFYTIPHIENEIGFSTMELYLHFISLLQNGPAIIHNIPYTPPLSYEIPSSEPALLHNMSYTSQLSADDLSSEPALLQSISYTSSPLSYEIPPSLVEELSENHNLVGIKDNKRVEIYASKGIHVWTGDDEESHEARWERGATGVYSLAANLVPGLMKELMFEGKNPKLNIKLKPLFDWLFLTPLPMDWDPLNVALAQLGVFKPVFRKSYDPFPVEKRREFVDLVKEIGRENFVGKNDVQVLDDTFF